MKQKYKIRVGAFITHIAHRTFVVSSDAEDDAIEKAKDMFYKRQMKTARNNDVGDIQVDYVEKLER